MMSHTIPYGRSLKISYYGQAGTGGDIPQANMHLSQYTLEITLSPVNDYDNRHNTWVAATIANFLKDDPRTFEGILEPVNDVFMVTSTTGDVLCYKMYGDDLLVRL
jgi:hypothetical protein